jgi:hypothetical protein
MLSASSVSLAQQQPVPNAWAAAKRTHSFFSTRSPLIKAVFASGQ